MSVLVLLAARFEHQDVARRLKYYVVSDCEQVSDRNLADQKYKLDCCDACGSR